MMTLQSPFICSTHHCFFRFSDINSKHVFSWVYFQEKESVSFQKFDRTIRRLSKLQMWIPLQFLYYDRYGNHITIGSDDCLDHAMDEFRHDNRLNVEVKIYDH